VSNDEWTSVGEESELDFQAQQVMRECPGLGIEIVLTGDRKGPYGIQAGALCANYVTFEQAWMVLAGVSLGWRAAQTERQGIRG
jgi:hypothetical protein